MKTTLGKINYYVRESRYGTTDKFGEDIYNRLCEIMGTDDDFQEITLLEICDHMGLHATLLCLDKLWPENNITGRLVEFLTDRALTRYSSFFDTLPDTIVSSVRSNDKHGSYKHIEEVHSCYDKREDADYAMKILRRILGDGGFRETFKHVEDMANAGGELSIRDMEPWLVGAKQKTARFTRMSEMRIATRMVSDMIAKEAANENNN